MRTIRTFLQGGIALTLATTAPVVFAATYEVGPNKQYKSLKDVASRLQPGDVVELEGNATYAGDIRLTRSGTPDKKITIRGIPVSGKRPVLSGGTNTLEIQANHYVVENVEITKGSNRCYFHHGHDITLRAVSIHDCPSHGILGAVEDSGSLTVEYSEVYNCGDGDRRHPIYMDTDQRAYPGSVFRLQHSYIHNANGGHNVKSRAERNEIYYNWIEGALYHELELIGPDGSDGGKREDSDVVGNVLRKTNNFWVVRFGGDGTGDTNGRYRFVNNTVILQSGSSGVFRLFDGIESLEAHNNVFYAPSGSTFRVLEDGSAKWKHGKQIIAGSNNWVLSSARQVPSQWTGTITGTDPGFTSLANFNLTPTASSPLVNAGATNLQGPSGYPFPNPLAVPQFLPPAHKVEAVGTAKARPVSGRIDIGAYEFVAPGGSAPDPGTGGAGGSGGAPDPDPGNGDNEPDPGTGGEGGSGGSPDPGTGGGDADPGTGGEGGSDDPGTNDPGTGGSGDAPDAGDEGNPPGTGGDGGDPADPGDPQGEPPAVEEPGDDDGGVSCQAVPGGTAGAGSALLFAAAALALSRRKRG